MKVYIDTDTADAGPRRPGSPTTDEVAANLRPALILWTKQFDDRQVRNRSKFLSIDHRFLLVTSAIQPRHDEHEQRWSASSTVGLRLQRSLNRSNRRPDVWSFL